MTKPILFLRRDQMIPWPGLNARSLFKKKEDDELAQSIAENDLAQPLGVRLNETPPHWIFAGERRWKACEGILDDIPVYIRDIEFDVALRMNLVENIQREDLTPMEEAHAFQRYINETGISQTELAKVFGKTPGWVSNRIRLRRLTSELEISLEEGILTASQARDLILPFGKLPDELWLVLAGSVRTQLKKKAGRKKNPLRDEEIRMVVSKVALAMSKWLDLYLWNEDDDQDMYPYYIQVPQERWSSAPKGTVVSYLYGPNPNSATSRAFDLDWWQMEMALAQVVYQEEKKAREEEDTEKDGGDLQWSRSLGPIPEEMEVNPNQVYEVYSPLKEGLDQWRYRDELSLNDKEMGGKLSADPTAISDEYLVFQERKGGVFHQPRILCTSEDVFKGAVESLAQKKKQLIERRLSRAAKQDAEKSETINLQESLPALVVVGTILRHNPAVITSAIGALPIASWKEVNWNGAFYSYLVGLEKEAQESLLKLLVYRLLRSPDGNEMDPAIYIQREVGKELRIQLVKELAVKIELPVWKDETPAEADIPEPDGEEE